MKKSIKLLLITLAIVSSAIGQTNRNTVVGRIQDRDKNPLPGASIVVLNSSYVVNANESGEYLIDWAPSGKISIQVSYVGYQTKLVDYLVKAGENYLNFTLESKDISLKGVNVKTQNRERHSLDGPITMSVIENRFMENLNINQLDELAGFVPGMQVRMQGVDRPSIVIRGLTSDEVSPTAQPRVSVFYNNVPISRSNGASVELFDMQRVEVLKGPQGTLFGRGAEIGAVHYISNKPTEDFGGYLNAGMGNFNHKEINGAINVPVVENKLLLRAAGTYDYQDGYIKNTFGGNLNGKNTIAGRFSALFLPSVNDKIELVVNYQDDSNPGLGFMSMNYPNTNGSKDPFEYNASLEQADQLATQREIFDAALTIKHYRNENSFFTSTSSYRTIDAYSRWDGDGTAAAAIDMSEGDGAKQFYQEIRYNYSRNNILTGSIGASYWNEQASQNYWFSPNEQNLVHLMFNTGYLVTPDGQPIPMTNLPSDPRLGPLAGMPLVTSHQEENKSDAVNQALEVFADGNYQLTNKLSITAGLRVSDEWFKLNNQSQMSGGEPATLGFFTQNYPNIFFKSGNSREITESNIAFTGRAGLKFVINENSNVYAGYSRGRRPKVLQFTSTGEEQVLDAEIVNSYDLGFKALIAKRLWFDLGTFYHDYNHFQTSAWVADSTTGEYNYLVSDGGKANAYGAEANLKYSVYKGIQLFGNYAYIHARFADKDADGVNQAYAGNMFRLTPEHSFAVGVNARIKLMDNLYIFAVPSYVYQTQVYFEDANTPGLDQAAYGLLNLRTGVELPEQKLTLAIWGSNLLGEKYIVSAGNTGSLFGSPTQIPGAPRMFGTKISWKF